MKAEILTIGTELLLGEIADTNTSYIARSLASIGVNVFRTTSVGDNEKRIAACIRESLERVDLVITTGGLGPTVDDPTRAAAAASLDRELEFHPELWIDIQQLFKRWGRTAGENNRRQAFLPAGSQPIRNPVGTAPGFIIETREGCIISLPGVPLEMETLMEETVIPYIRREYSPSSTIVVRLLHTAGLGESTIDSHISEFETLSNPTVGLAAHSGQVDIRLTARAESIPAAERMLDDLEAQIRSRLGDTIYGTDGTTLQEAALEHLIQRELSISILESGLEGRLSTRLNRFSGTFTGGLVLPPMSRSEFEAAIHDEKSTPEADIMIAVHLEREAEHRLWLQMRFSGSLTEKEISFGGPPEAASMRAVNLALDFLRKQSSHS